ncbi:hypothetical protein MTR_8g099025 [Medicago truncatula]|uniref:Uncharacterized protein n=1 Tax=Medicago truncatula TaxID=3880 RepID=A0A072TUE9_MEDTR|nr:hypothetical protein MTR_8g099025 [Medicago truncatula]
MKPDMDKGEEQKENDREPMKMSDLKDDGDDLDDSNKEYFSLFVMPKKMTNFKWVLGVRFGTKDKFKEAITNYAIYNRTCLKRFKN